MVPFCTRHTPSCHFSHIDPAGLPFLGYFPQDIIGYPIFDFYHEDDLLLIREVYDIIIKQEGSFFSKPYRFKIFNGDYIILETEWSCFINPWSKKFEFIVGQHRIVQGPTNVDVFTETEKTSRRTNDQVRMKKAEEDISSLLSQPVQRVVVHQKDQRMLQEKTFKRKRTLAARVSELIESGKNNEGKKEILSSDEGTTWSDKESVLIGVISPHRENSEDLHDQRLQDNIERFFASQPKTMCPSSSTGSSSQNQSPDGSGSNDGSSSNNKSSNDSAFQSGSCGDGVTRDGKMDESNNGDAAVVKSSEHAARTFMESLTEEMLAQHDRVCQRQMRKGQSQLLHHSKSIQANDDAACMNKKKACKDQPKNKKRVDSCKNGISTLDEMFTSFAVQPPFALGFAPFILGSNTCQSCHATDPDQQQLPQQRHQHILLPVMCSVPICSSSISMASSSQQSSSGGGNQMMGTGMSRSVRVQTESTSPVRHMSPFERDDCPAMSSGFHKDLLVSSGGGKESASMTEGSFESTSFASSSGEESSGRDHAAASTVQSPEEQTLDGILMMEMPIKTEVPAPWITDAQEYSDEVIIRFQVKDCSPALPDAPRDQPDLVRKQFSLLQKEKTSTMLSEILGDSGSETDFQVSCTATL